jgi:hypothetical protein
MSRTSSKTLAPQGFEHVYNMLGGINEWKMYFTVIKPEPTNVGTPSSTISPSLSPSAVVSPIVSLTPVPTTTLVTGGFEVVFAIMGLLGMSYIVIKKRKER